MAGLAHTRTPADGRAVTHREPAEGAEDHGGGPQVYGKMAPVRLNPPSNRSSHLFARVIIRRMFDPSTNNNTP